MIWAILLTHARESRATRHDFWLRIVASGRLGLRWLAVALFLHPLLILAAWVISVALGDLESGLKFPNDGVMGLLSLAFFTFWFGPLPEEIGWRGYALDRLLSKQSALWASVTIGVVWAFWHLPLFFVPGTFHSNIGLGSARSTMFLASMLPLSILMTWVYTNTMRSTLGAAIVHFSGNLGGALLGKPDRLALIELILLCGAAAAVTVVGGGGMHLKTASIRDSAPRDAQPRL